MEVANMEGFVSIAEHNEFRERMDGENKRLSKRLDAMEDMINKITIDQLSKVNVAIERMLIQIDTMMKVQNEHDNRIGVLEARDGEKWRTVVSYLITAGCSVAATLFLTHIGLK